MCPWRERGHHLLRKVTEVRACIPLLEEERLTKLDQQLSSLEHLLAQLESASLKLGGQEIDICEAVDISQTSFSPCY